MPRLKGDTLKEAREAVEKDFRAAKLRLEHAQRDVAHFAELLANFDRAYPDIAPAKDDDADNSPTRIVEAFVESYPDDAVFDRRLISNYAHALGVKEMDKSATNFALKKLVDDGKLIVVTPGTTTKMATYKKAIST